MDSLSTGKMADPSTFAVLLKQLLISHKSGQPDELFTQDEFRSKYGIGINRVREIQAHIKSRNMDYAPTGANGKSIIAPLSVWYQAMKETRERQSA